MSVKTCYLEETTGLIKWETVARKEGHGPDTAVTYTDGGWNPGKDCFFTEEQCRRFHKLSPKNLESRLIKVADRLEKIASGLRRDR